MYIRNDALMRAGNAIFAAMSRCLGLHSGLSGETAPRPLFLDNSDPSGQSYWESRMQKQAGIYARYSPGKDRDFTSTIDVQVSCAAKKQEADAQIRGPFRNPLPKLPRYPHFPDGAPPSTRFPRNTKSRGQGID